MSTTECVFLLVIVLVPCAFSAKILGVFPTPSFSHQRVFQPIWKELSLRGHEVTVLSPNPLDDPSLINLTEIDLGFSYKDIEKQGSTFSHGVNHWTMVEVLTTLFLDANSNLFLHENVQNFISDNTRSFDVVLIEVIDPISYAFAAKFKCPFIAISSLGLSNPAHEKVGTPGHAILHPDLLTPYYGGDLSFIDRVDGVLFDLYERYVYNYVYLPKVYSIAKKYFGDQIPDLKGIEKNASMIFLNENPIIHGVRPYGPNVIVFGGGVHLKAPKPLPLELKSYLDNAPEGVIYFSFGSNVKSALLPEEKRNMIIKTLAKLPYKVLWKFEDDELIGKPKNVLINKWLPQQDVLQHPNIKLFITQAGLQSTEEALLNGVPLLAIPFIGDQWYISKSIKKLGVGLYLDFGTLNEEVLRKTILEVIGNPTYKDKAVEVGKLLKDQPMTGLEKVIWWTEYVIRNKGAAYLRNPRADVSWSEFLILDVLTFLLFILLAVSFLVYRMCQFIIQKFKNKTLKEKYQ